MGKQNMTRSKEVKAKHPCEKYELAITSYVIGEDIGLPKEELMAHLKTCKNCRRDLADWQDTYLVMRMEAESNTPEGKKKMKDSFEALKKRMAEGERKERVIDTEWLIGTAAGVVWRFLKQNGKTDVETLAMKTRIRPALIERSLGWLAKEKQVCLSEDGQHTYAYLPQEKEGQPGCYPAQPGITE
jgi:hypothetical protein